MSVAIFGASVTKQRFGYARMLKGLLREHKVHIFGYGGMHLKNGAICFVDDVLKVKPELCLIDWFSTGYLECTKNTLEYIDTLLYKFEEVECKCVFLFFPHLQTEGRKEFYAYCKNHLNQKGIPFIDVNNELPSLDNILRDVVHTTKHGSEVYGRIIAEKLKRITPKFAENIEKTKYYDVKKRKINKIFKQKVILQGNAEIIGFLLKIGPHSGEILVNDGARSFKKNTWDQHCYYTRDQFDLDIKVDSRVELDVLYTNFDTTSCRENIDFTKFEKKIVICMIYYIGNGVAINNIEDGVTALPLMLKTTILEKYRNIKAELKNILFGIA